MTLVSPRSSQGEVVRTLVVRCPDWPVVAAGVSLDEPAAVFFASDDSKWITGETLLIAGGLR